MYGIAPHQLIEDFRYVHNFYGAGFPPGQLVGENADRWALLFWLTTSGQIQIAPTGLQSSTSGLLISASSIPFNINFERLGPLIGLSWQYLGGFGAEFVVTEVIYSPVIPES
jgi:hypothetical protein